MGGDADEMPTSGLGFIKKRMAARAAAPAAGTAAVGGQEIPGGSVSDAAYEHLKSLYPTKEALRAARDVFVVSALRDLLLRGCCIKAICGILVVSNNYIYLASSTGAPTRLRRAGFRGDLGIAPLALV